MIGTIAHEIKGDITDCKATKNDIARIENWALIFENPKELVQIVISNALANMQGLITDVHNISGDIKSSNYEDMGEQVADIMTKTVGKIPQAGEVNQFIY